MPEENVVDVNLRGCISCGSLVALTGDWEVGMVARVNMNDRVKVYCNVGH